MLIAVSGFLAYAGSFDAPFLFDDLVHIVQNKRIESLSSIGTLVSGRRPVIDMTLAANYALSARETVRSYHVVNLTIHLLVALALYGIVHRSLSRISESSRIARSARSLALATSLIWVVHPLLTQSVTYLIQRAESLMSLFYLLTLYCLIRGAESKHRLAWSLAAVATCAFGMGSKAVMLTAPVAALCYDRAFLSGSFSLSLKRRWGLYLGLASTWGVLWWCGVARSVIAPVSDSATVGFGFKGITPLTYALTQPEVVLRYLTLSVWPRGLCLDYVWPTVASIGAAVAPMSILLIFAGVFVALVRRNLQLAFVAGWFFFVLLPTSSFIPIKDVLFEHRAYLPSAGVVLMLVLGAHEMWKHVSERLSLQSQSAVWSILIVVLAAGSLGYATFRRNVTYLSAVSMWEDVTRKRPGNARGFEQLGTSLVMQGRKREAAAQYAEAIRIDPGFVSARANLANALFETGDIENAEAQYRDVLRLQPDHADAWVNLGHTLRMTGRTDEGIEAYRSATHVDPRRTTPRTLAGAHLNLGSELAKTGRLREAVAALEEAVRIRPDYEKAHLGLAQVLLGVGEPKRAVTHLRRTLDINPDNAVARRKLDEALAARNADSDE